MVGSPDIAFWRRHAPWLLSLTIHASLLVAAADYWWRRASEPPLAIVPVQLRLVELPSATPDQAPPEPVPTPAATPSAPPEPVAGEPAPAAVVEEPPVAENRPPPPSPPAPALSDAAPTTPAAPAPAAPRRPSLSAVPQEVARGGFPGMKTMPLSRTAPLTKEEWEKLAKTYNPGTAENGIYEVANAAGIRAARAKRAAPLTPEEYARLAKIYRPGRPQNGAFDVAEAAGIRSTSAPRSAPYTKEEREALENIYWTGTDNGGTTPVEREAGLRGALSIQTALASPAPQVNYAARLGPTAGEMMARATEQPPPEIPSDIPFDNEPVTVVARFNVAADGTAKVELAGPAAEPRLNDALLAAFKKWRFAPAYRSGRAVDSVIDYRLTLALE
jgi:outer membrane biosynthesis protein TonB